MKHTYSRIMNMKRVIGIIEDKEKEYKQLHPKAKDFRLRKRKK